jgi:phosphocarrier protein HPr
MIRSTNLMPSLQLTLTHAPGLHARAAAQWVKIAQAHAGSIIARNLTNGRGPVNAKSILGMLSLGATEGAQIELAATGEHADEALRDLQALVARDFVERP